MREATRPGQAKSLLISSSKLKMLNKLAVTLALLGRQLLCCAVLCSTCTFDSPSVECCAASSQQLASVRCITAKIGVMLALLQVAFIVPIISARAAFRAAALQRGLSASSHHSPRYSTLCDKPCTSEWHQEEPSNHGRDFGVCDADSSTARLLP